MKLHLNLTVETESSPSPSPSPRPISASPTEHIPATNNNWLKRGLTASTVILTFLILFPPTNLWLKSTPIAKILQGKPPSKHPLIKIVFPLKGLNAQTAKVTDVPGSIRPLGCKKNCRNHAGVDYAYKGDILSVLDGTISEVKPDSPVGGIVGVESGKYTIRYVHLNRDSVRKWKIGQPVQAGELLGLVRETFAGSSGAHPHIELYENGKLSDIRQLIGGI